MKKNTKLLLFIGVFILSGVILTIKIFGKNNTDINELMFREISLKQDEVIIIGELTSSGKSYRGFSYEIYDSKLLITILSGLVTSKYPDGSFLIDISDDNIQNVSEIAIKSGKEVKRISPAPDEANIEPESLLEGDFEYTITNGKAIITRYIEVNKDIIIPKDVIIPSEINGYPVNSIGNSAFAGINNLKSVIIPDGVTNIGEWAFENCTELRRIVIPDSVDTIGHGAFSRASNLTDILIPKNLKVFEESVFMHCASLPNITIPDSVTTIKSHAFAYCNSMTEIFIPASVKVIEECAFYSCDNLASVVIESNETEIDEEAFFRTAFERAEHD